MKKLFLLMTLILTLISCVSQAPKEKKLEVQEEIPESNFILVEGGRFIRGDDNSRFFDEKPAHSVILNNFYMSKYEVTQKEFREIMGFNPSYDRGENLPVENVTWYDAVMYANNLSVKEGKTEYYSITDYEKKGDTIVMGYVDINVEADGYRLPTEAEWEYAAKGGNKSEGYVFSGSNNLNDVAWTYETTKERGTQPVGQKKPNELGIYDMSGNVREWCGSKLVEYSTKELVNPIEGHSGNWEKVVRGGSIRINGHANINRYDVYPFQKSSDLGFRLVRNYSEVIEEESQQVTVDLENEESSDDMNFQEKFKKFVNNIKNIIESLILNSVKFFNKNRPNIEEFETVTVDKIELEERLEKEISEEDIDIEINSLIEELALVKDEPRKLALQNEIIKLEEKKVAKVNEERLGKRQKELSQGLTSLTKEAEITKNIVSTPVVNMHKKNLNNSLLEFESPVLQMSTGKYITRIDKLSNGNYRYVSFDYPKTISDEPNTVRENGYFDKDTSSFKFAAKPYMYVVVLREGFPVSLEVYKNGERVLQKNVQSVDYIYVEGL